MEQLKKQRNTQRSICLPQQQGWHHGILQAAAEAWDQPAGLPAALSAASAALQARHRRCQLKSGKYLANICLSTEEQGELELTCEGPKP